MSYEKRKAVSTGVAHSRTDRSFPAPPFPSLPSLSLGCMTLQLSLCCRWCGCVLCCVSGSCRFGVPSIGAFPGWRVPRQCVLSRAVEMSRTSPCSPVRGEPRTEGEGNGGGRAGRILLPLSHTTSNIRRGRRNWRRNSEELRHRRHHSTTPQQHTPTGRALDNGQWTCWLI